MPIVEIDKAEYDTILRDVTVSALMNKQGGTTSFMSSTPYTAK